LISLDHSCYDLQRRQDGAVVVRIRSRERADGRLPDAVFSFRRGDPQYNYWDGKLREQEVASH
jgi:hypothetical protein